MQKNRFGFRTAGFRDWSFGRAVEAIAAAGYSGVEVCLEHPDCRPEALGEQAAGRFAQLLRDCGVSCASVSYHGDFEPPRDRADNQLRALRLTPALGSDVLILNAEKAEPERLQEQWDDLRRRLERLLPQAENSGIRIALEPEPGHFLHSSADMARLISEVRHPLLAVNLDVGHAYLTDDDLGATIRELGDRIVHTHIEGMPAGEHRHLVPGEGDLNLAEVKTALDSIGYGGWLTVDLFRIGDDPEGFARRSFAALQSIFGG